MMRISTYDQFLVQLTISLAGSDNASAWRIVPFCKKRFEETPPQDWMDRAPHDLGRRGLAIVFEDGGSTRVRLDDMVMQIFSRRFPMNLDGSYSNLRVSRSDAKSPTSSAPPPPFIVLTPKPDAPPAPVDRTMKWITNPWVYFRLRPLDDLVPDESPFRTSQAI